MTDFCTPILFLVFNRPAETQKSFSMLRKLKPKELYIAADGPRLGIEGEEAKCSQVKEIFEQILQ